MAEPRKGFFPVYSAFSAGRRAESGRVRRLEELASLRGRCEAFRSCVAEGRWLSFVFNCRCHQQKVRRLISRSSVLLIFHLLHEEGIVLSSTLLQRLWQWRGLRSSPQRMRECGEARSGRARRRSDGVPRELAGEAGLSRRGYPPWGTPGGSLLGRRECPSPGERGGRCGERRAARAGRSGR